MSTLYLIPNLLGDTPPEQVLPAFNARLIGSLSHFFVEDIRNARRFLKRVIPEIEIDGLHFLELNKRTSETEQQQFLEVLLGGNDAGIISEAGCPGIADPGAEVVALAHRHGIRVVPLVGPSSIFLALMASGMNGQSFAFTGYLPVKQPERVRRLLQLEKLVHTLGQSQIFMETPYRNNALLSDLLKNCQPGTRLCIAADITTPYESIITQTIAQWRKSPPALDKQPVIFIMGR